MVTKGTPPTRSDKAPVTSQSSGQTTTKGQPQVQPPPAPQAGTVIATEEALPVDAPPAEVPVDDTTLADAAAAAGPRQFGDRPDVQTSLLGEEGEEEDSTPTAPPENPRDRLDEQTANPFDQRVDTGAADATSHPEYGDRGTFGSVSATPIAGFENNLLSEAAAALGVEDKGGTNEDLNPIGAGAVSDPGEGRKAYHEAAKGYEDHPGFSYTDSGFQVVHQSGIVSSHVIDGEGNYARVTADAEGNVHSSDAVTSDGSYKETTILNPDGTTTTTTSETTSNEPPPEQTAAGGSPTSRPLGLPSWQPADDTMPLDPVIQAQLDAELAKLRNAEGNSGDEVTDPADDEEQVSYSDVTINPVAEGHAMFGQPADEAERGTPSSASGGWNDDSGAVDFPEESGNVSGSTRTDDPDLSPSQPLEQTEETADDGVDSSPLGLPEVEYAGGYLAEADVDPQPLDD